MFGVPQEESTKNTFFFEEFSSKDVNESTVGRKGLSLFRVNDMDVPVPDFFVISPKVFADVVERSLVGNAERLMKDSDFEGSDVEKVILKTDFQVDFQEELLRQYTKLSGFTDAWVSVRSSVVFPERPEVSFSGIFDTQLNVRGFDQLKEAIKKVYASVYTDSAVAYANAEGLDLATVRMGVVVQKMVQAEVSGVAFTVDPITKENDRMSIEAVFGLGTVISSGELTPDSYTLNKKDLSVVEKHISPQEWMKVRTLGKKKRKGSEEKIRISQTWSHRQKLEDKYMDEVAKIALVIESKSKKSQDVEWVLGGGKIWVLQTKSDEVPTASDTVLMLSGEQTLKSVVADIIEKSRSASTVSKKAMKGVAKYVKAHAKETKIEKKEKPVSVKDRGLEFVISGIGASNGVVAGVARVVPFPMKKDFEVGSNDILIIKEYAQDMNELFTHCAGVVLDSGGLTSDPAILARELKLPAIVGVGMIADMVSDGDTIQIDGNVGSVYRVKGLKLPKEEKVVVRMPEEEVKKEEVVEEDDELNVQLPPTATKVFVNDGFNSPLLPHSSGVVFMDLDRMMIENGRHPLAFVEDKKFKEYSTELANEIDRVADIVSPKEVVVSIGSATVEEFSDLTKGKSFEDGELPDALMGAQRLVRNRELLLAGLKVVKRVRNVNRDKNVSLAIHGPMNGSMMADVKKEISGIGLRRSSTFNIYAVIDSPGEVIVAEEILDCEIDGIIFNTPSVAMQMQGIPLGSKNAKYMLSSNSVIKAVESVKKVGGGLFVVVEDDMDLLKKCVSMGVKGVVTGIDSFVDVKKKVADEEASLILGVG